jgi:hypothetical protein
MGIPSSVANSRPRQGNSFRWDFADAPLTSIRRISSRARMWSAVSTPASSDSLVSSPINSRPISGSIAAGAASGFR